MKRKSAYLEFEDVAFFFDIVTSEKATHTVSASTHPVEEGADVTDHVKPEPTNISIETFISNTPVRDPNFLYDGQVAGLELSVPTKEKTIYPTPGSLMNAAMSELSSALSGGPEPWKALVTKYPRAFNAPKDVLEQLLDWQERAILGKVIFPDRAYENMLITSVETSRTAETSGGLGITISFQSIRLVEAKLVDAPVPTEPRAKKKVNKGKQPPVEVPLAKQEEIKKSLAKKLIGR